MRRRVIFPNKVLPYLLLAPQLAITVVFFFWPAAQAIYYSVLLQDPFGLRTQFIWLENFQATKSRAAVGCIWRASSAQTCVRMTRSRR